MKLQTLLLTLATVAVFAQPAIQTKQASKDVNKEAVSESVLEKFTKQSRLREEICPDVMRWAYNPSSGECRVLASCESVPSGWEVRYQECLAD